MGDGLKIFLGVAGTTTTAALETSVEHPATIFAAACVGVHAMICGYYKIKNKGK